MSREGNSTRTAPPDGTASGGESRWASLVYRRLRRIHAGQLQISDRTGLHRFGTACQALPSVHLRVHSGRFYRDLVWGGSMGAAEDYLRGDWEADDLVGLFRLLSRNADVLAGFEAAARWWLVPFNWLRQWRTRNSQSGSRKNIEAHYDLGNDFFRIFLDDTLSYSCAFFASPQTSLRDASLEKYDRICSKLRLRPEHHVLEIGGGWGGFALYAAGRYGCHVTTTTISQQQRGYAAEAIRAAGLESRITLLADDYRQLHGQYDRLVSIEMIEAVGHEFLPTYFGQCSRLLKPDGEMLLQAITIPDQRYDSYRRSVDFIQRYVFPGGCLPCLAAIADAVKRATDLQLVHLEDMSAHYVETLRRWRQRFLESLAAVREQRLGDRFIRTWDYYLAYCEAGFSEHWTGVSQSHWIKPLARPYTLQ